MRAASGVAKGAYILADAPGGKPDAILMATGSEVSLCLAAYETLTAQGVKVRVVSMPSWDIFEHQSREYRDSVLAARRHGAGFPSSKPPRSAGIVTWARKGKSSACTPLELPRR